MTIASEIQRIQTNIANAYDAAEAKGATLPDVENTENLASTIESIEAHADPVLQDKVILANGEYTADAGYDGIGTATVAVNATGATEVATNRTGAAINAGDKVWINQEYYEAGNTETYQAVSTSYMKSLGGYVITNSGVYKDGVLIKSFVDGGSATFYEASKTTTGLAYYGIKPPYCFRTPSGHILKTSYTLLTGSSVDVTTSLVAENGWDLTNYVYIQGSNNLFMYSNPSGFSTGPIVEVDLNTGEIVKKYTVSNAVRFIPASYNNRYPYEWSVYFPIMLPSGKIKARIFLSTGNYTATKLITLNNETNTASFSTGSSSDPGIGGTTGYVIYTSDKKYAVSKSNNTSIIVYDMVSSGDSGSVMIDPLSIGLPTPEVSDMKYVYDVVHDLLMICSGTEAIGVYKYSTDTKVFTKLPINEIPSDCIGFDADSSDVVTSIYNRNSAEYTVSYINRFLENQIIPYRLLNEFTITGTAAEGIATGATGNVYLGDKGSLQSKAATSNGTVTPSEGYYGLSKVTVNVVGTGVEIEGKNYTGAVINEGDKVWINPYYYESDEEIYATTPRYSYSSTSSMNNGNYPPIPTPDFHYCFSNYSNYNFYSIIDNSQVGTSSYITSNWDWFRVIEYVNGIQYVFYGENSSGGMQRTDIGLSWSHAKWQPILGDPSFVIDWSGTEDILHKIDVDTGQIISSWNLGYKLTEANSRARFLGFSVNQDQLVLATATGTSSNALFELNSDGSVIRTNLDVYCLTMDTFAQTSDKSQIISIYLQRVFDVSNLNDIKTISTPFILSSGTYPGWVNFHTNEDLLVVKKVNYASNKLDTYRYNVSTKSWDLISLDFPGSTHNKIAIDVKGDLSSVLYCSSGSGVTNVTLEEIVGNNLVNFNLVTANTQTGTATESIAIGNTGTVKVGANITPTLVTKTITENGTYSASSDSADGFSEVTVNVSGSSSEYTCLNSTGSNISEGERVYIAANTNPKLITWASLTSLGYTGIASEDIANGASGKVKAYMKEPHTGTLEQWDRVDGKGTVVGFFTDGNGTEYAVVVADAAYRSSQSWYDNVNDRSQPYTVDTLLPNYTSQEAVLAATESATFNMDVIRGNYDLSYYPAFNSAYSNTITFDGVIYKGLLPNAVELQMIYNNREYLDTLDTSLIDYPANSLVSWGISSDGFCTSNEQSDNYIWRLLSTGAWSSYYKHQGGYNFTKFGVIPVFEIPVDSGAINTGEAGNYNSGSGGEADEADDDGRNPTEGGDGDF